MSTKDFELIVFGSGPSGSTVATKAAEAGHRVALIESREMGGTCALRGCNPKKVYTNAAELVDCVRRSKGSLLGDADVSVDWANLHAFKNEFTDPVPDLKRKSLRKAGVTELIGDARFISPDQIQLGDRQLSAERFCIATGAKPAPLDFSGAEFVIHTDQFFQLKAIPDRVVMIGGGYVSMELAHVLARCGCRVTIVERNQQVLTGFDPDLVSQLVQHSQQHGIEFAMSREVASISSGGEGEDMVVTLDDGSSLRSGLVVHGAGRIPSLDGLDLVAGRIEYDTDGIKVCDYRRSVSNERVFATGDCAASGMPRLTPVANEDARIVAKNVFAEEMEAVPDYGSVAKVVFTTPAIASVGLSESAAERSGLDFEVRSDDTSTWGSVRKTGKTVAGYKILVDRKSDAILGAHLLGPSAQETINLFTLAIKHQLTATDLKSTLFAYPTFGSDVRRMV